jgi:two-component system, cell cycle sensor histidine kinase and response regulator CckA
MKEFVPADLFNAIDMVVMERQTDGSFQLKGTALDWFVRFCPESADGGEKLDLGKNFVFLENFLIDAEDFWLANASGLLKSGLWIESDSSGNDCAFEATAVSLGDKKILLIKLCWTTYAEKQHIIQKGRELGLEYHRITRLEEALQRAQVDLKEQVKRRTAKLSKANEMLRQEIDERRKAEKALRESTETLRAILAASPVGIGLIKGRTLDWANKALCDLLEQGEGSLSGKEANTFFPDHEEWRAAAHEIITGIERTGIGRVEANLATRSGRELYCFLQGSPLDSLDLSKGVIVATLDITERKRAEEARILLEKQLNQAQKMEAMGLLAGGIAHDFNNILSAIIGYSELATTHVTPNTRLERNLGEVLKASMRAKELVQQILTLTRQGEQQLEPLELGPVVKEALRFLRASLPTTIKIRQEISAGSHLVSSNATQIHQVLMNLCTNAAHSMREKGGVIEIHLADVDLSRGGDVLRMPDLKPGPYLKLSVRDTGCGIDPSVMERIFDPYFTTKAPGEGTGLGLAVVQGIIKSQGGCVTVSSEAGKGTVFHVFLPRIAGLAKHKEQAVEPPARGKEHILFVDDEVTLAELGKEALEALGYSVVAKTSSLEALALFRDQPKKFDLVITDQTMPEMTGLALAKKLLEIRPDIPIVLCTGYSQQVAKERTRETGIREFLMKPLMLRDLARVVRRLLD